MAYFRILHPLSTAPQVAVEASVLLAPSNGYVQAEALPEELRLTFTGKSALEGWRLVVTAATTFTYGANGAPTGAVGSVKLFDPAGALVAQASDLAPLGLSMDQLVQDPTLALVGADRIEGSSGADTLLGFGGSDELLGLDGDDQLSGGAGSDVAYGNAGDDTLDGGDDNDFLYGGAGNDRISGGQGGDVATGGIGSDVIAGAEGEDLLFGNAGADTITGGDGFDRIFGERDNDILAGGDAGDEIRGGAGDDRVSGDAGDDDLFGNDGNDLMRGGAGDDRMDGGLGFDVAFFSGSRSDYVVVTADGVTTISGPDGVDTLVGFEQLVFDADPLASGLDGWAV